MPHGVPGMPITNRTAPIGWHALKGRDLIAADTEPATPFQGVPPDPAR